jgi:hypothetical protein
MGSALAGPIFVLKSLKQAWAQRLAASKHLQGIKNIPQTLPTLLKQV